MFIRTKTSPKGLQKVQIVENIRNGSRVQQKVLRHVGTAQDDLELEKLKQLAAYIKAKIEEERQPCLFPPEEMAHLSLIHRKTPSTPPIQVEDLVEESRQILGVHDVYGQVYKDLGFDRILPVPSRQKVDNDYLKHLTMARIATPASKRKSVDLLNHDFGISLDLDRVYRLMDKIDETCVQKLQNLSLNHTQQTLAFFQESIDILFYDATTLYFESFTQDDLKQNGYSKDCKFNQPQVVLCLFVTTHGLPIGYEVFPGSTYEGHTLLTSLESLKNRFSIRNLVFVADSGLLNTDNLDALEKAGYTYIVGARLKNLTAALQDKVTDSTRYTQLCENMRTQTIELSKEEDEKKKFLIVSHSQKRAFKDSHDRAKAIESLRKKMSKSSNPSSLISNYGYKKYLKIKGKAEVVLDEEKLLEQEKWDGLHGVITNSTTFKPQDIINHYKGLWQVEETFRVTKNDLKIRPIYHWTPSRIRAHIALCYMALCCVRHLEYRVSKNYEKLSPEVIRETLMSVQASVLRHKPSGQRYLLPSSTRPHALKIYHVMGLKLASQPIPI